jgi:putative hydrolase of the HAD superfamily
MTETKYDGVFFDIGGVILDLASVREGHVEFISRLAAHEECENSAALIEGHENSAALIEEWRSALGEYFQSSDGTEYRCAKDGYQHAVDTVVRREVPEDEWMELFETASAECLQPTPHAVETIQTLDEMGLYLGIISDIDTWEADAMLDRFEIRECFDHMTTSEEVGRTKPDSAIFETALEKATVAPERSLYVGDRYEHDMRGGTQAGLVTVAHGGSADEHAESEAVDYAIDDLSTLMDLIEK